MSSLAVPAVPRSAVPLLILAAAAWGIGTVISKRAVAEIPPLTLLPIQLAASVVVLAVLLRWRGMALRDPSVPKGLGRLGLLNPGLAYALSLIGLVHITASLSVLIWALEPILILALAAWFLHERVGRSFVGLSTLAIGGVLLVIYAPGSAGSPLGIGLTVAGVVLCAVYTVVARRWLTPVESTAPVVLAQQGWALVLAIGLFGASGLAGSPTWHGDVSALGWASAVGSGVVYYSLAYWFYLSGLRRVRASTAAAAFYLIPVFGIGGGFVLLGERFDPVQWLGAAVAVAAVLILLRRTA